MEGLICVGTLVVIVSLLVLASRPKRCEICGNLIKRTSYVWKLRGRKQLVCPQCNRKLESRQSDAAFGVARVARVSRRRESYDWRNFECFVRGANRRPEVVSSCRPGQELRLVREPDNTADPNAIKVCDLDGEQLGYIGRDTAAWLSRAIDDGVVYQVRLIEKSESEEYGYGLKIHLTTNGSRGRRPAHDRGRRGVVFLTLRIVAYVILGLFLMGSIALVVKVATEDIAATSGTESPGASGQVQVVGGTQ